MSTSGTRSQDSTAIIVTGDDVGTIDDTSDWEGPFTKYDRCGEPTRHNYVRCPMCGTEILDGETSTTFHRPACHYK